jgi:hypothetical protein
VPDVAADAAAQTGAAIRLHGRWLSSDGTLPATRVWAVITALIDQFLTARGDRPTGGPARGHSATDIVTSLQQPIRSTIPARLDRRSPS